MGKFHPLISIFSPLDEKWGEVVKMLTSEFTTVLRVFIPSSCFTHILSKFLNFFFVQTLPIFFTLLTWYSSSQKFQWYVKLSGPDSRSLLQTSIPKKNQINFWMTIFYIKNLFYKKPRSLRNNYFEKKFWNRHFPNFNLTEIFKLTTLEIVDFSNIFYFWVI